MKGSDPVFTREVIKRAGTQVSSCFNCTTCTSGCGFAHIMDHRPHEMIRLVQMGMKEPAFKASAPWLCVGCNTCSGNCPNAIDIPAVMDAVRQMSIETGDEVAEPAILSFHETVLDSIHRYGRTHKLEIMMRYKVNQRDWFSDISLGMRMFSKRKLEVLPSKVEQLPEVKKIFRKAG